LEIRRVCGNIKADVHLAAAHEEASWKQYDFFTRCKASEIEIARVKAIHIKARIEYDSVYSFCKQGYLQLEELQYVAKRRGYHDQSVLVDLFLDDIRRMEETLSIRGDFKPVAPVVKPIVYNKR
jgi:hypothetical protein